MRPETVSWRAGGTTWTRPSFAGGPSEPTDRVETNVVVPSLSLDPRELAKVTGASLYEERQLHETLGENVVFVSSCPLNPGIAEYYLQYLPGKAWGDRQVHLVSVGDSSSTPLSKKLLSAGSTMDAVRASMGAYPRMTCFVSSSYEKQVSSELGIPLYATDPSLLYWGTKAGSRQTFAECGVPHPEGTPLVHSASELAAAIDEVALRNPSAERMVVKLNEGFSGEGNAVLRLPRLTADMPRASRLEALDQALRSMKFQAPRETWEGFSSRFADLGVLAELFVEGATSSPSAQAKILPDGTVQVVSTHEQVLDDQIFLGSRFPAAPGYRALLMEHCRRIGENLAAKGCRERFAVDFMAVPAGDGGWSVHAIEINLRKGGTTHPWETMQQLTGGHTQDSGVFVKPDGEARFYRASDNEKMGKFVGLQPADVLDIAAREGLHFDLSRGVGSTFHLLGAVPEYGKFGVTCIAETPQAAERLYEKTVQAIDRAVSPRLEGPSVPVAPIPGASGDFTSLALETLSLPLAGAWLRTAAFDGGRTVAAVNERGNCRAEVYDNGSLAFSLGPHQTPVRAVAVRGDRVASGSADGEVKIAGSSSYLGNQGLVNDLAFSGDGSRLAVASSDHTVHLVDLSSGSATQLRGHGNWVRTVAFRGSQGLISGSADGTLRLWAADGRPERVIEVGGGSVLSCAVSPDGAQALAVTSDKRLSCWNLSTGEGLWERRFGWQPQQVTWGADGYAGFTSADGSVQLVRTADGALGDRLPLEHPVGEVDLQRAGACLQLRAASGQGQLAQWKLLPT